MSYRNPLHGLNSDGERPSGLPAHVPVQPGDQCSIMCSHDGIERDPSHEAAVQSWRDHQADLIPLSGGATVAHAGQEITTGAGFPPTIVIDLAPILQAELERRVAAGEPLPEGQTPETVAQWRAEHPDAPVLLTAAPGELAGSLAQDREHVLTTALTDLAELPHSHGDLVSTRDVVALLRRVLR